MHNSDIFTIAVRKFGPFELAMEKFWTSFCEKTGCKLQLNMVVMDLHELHERTLAANGLKNGDFDLAHINTDWIYEGYTSGAFEVLNNYIDENPPVGFPQGWSSSLLSLQEINKEIVGLPFHDGPECLIYRKDLFEHDREKENYFARYGQELKVPSTWEEFHQIARFFHRPEEKIYGSIFAGYPDGHNAVFDYCLQLWTRGGNLIDENNLIHIDNEISLAALAYYRKVLTDSSAVHPDAFQFDSVAAGAAFCRGEAAMMINWFGFAAMCQVDPGSEVVGKVDVEVLPADLNVDPASLNVYWLYTIGSGGRNKKLAYQFICFVTNVLNDKILTLTGGIGCRLSTWNDPEVNRLIPYYYKLEKLHKVAKMLPQHKNWAKMAAVIDQLMQKTMLTDENLSEILTQAQSQLDSLQN